MTKIVLTEEQAAVLETAAEPVAICRADGTIAGFVSPRCRAFTPAATAFTDEEVAAAERQLDSDGPWHTTEQVLARLESQQRA